MTDGQAGEPSDAELDRALEIDRLAQEFRERQALEPGLTAQAYAARCEEEGRGGGHGIRAKDLLPVLRGMGALARVSRRVEGPFVRGERVGPYEIRGVLGRGGMGVVYEAVEEGLGRVVALKAMHTAADNRFRERFAREARAAARLDHPAIVPVFGSGEHPATGEHGGVLWYAMRRVDGVGLDQLLADLGGSDGEARRSALSRLGAAAAGSSVSMSGSAVLAERERAAVAVALRLADALAYAHAEGVLHRDIKPANVLLDRDGGTLLTDFGLCKVEGDASLTRDTDIVGTLRYMPPESMGGQTDGRGDVYGVGLLLLEILAGRPAFDISDRRGLIQEVLHRDPLPLRDGTLQIPDDLEKVVRKAIAKLPEERYATATDLGEDLRALLAGQPVRARATTSPLYLLRLFVRRNRALSTTIAAAVLALGVGAAFYIKELRSANVEISAARDLAEQRAAEASVATAEATLRVGDTSGAAGALAAVPLQHRGWMWQHLSDRVGLGTRRIPLGDTEPLGFSAAADGSRAVAFSRDRLLLLGWDDAEGPRVVEELDRSAVGVGFDPLGTLHFIDRDTRQLVRWTPGEEGGSFVKVAELPRRATGVRFSPDGSTALILDGYTRLVAVELSSGSEVWSRIVPVNRIDSFEALSATAFVIGSTGGQVVLGEAGEEPFQQPAQHFGRVRDLLAEDGELLASGGEAGQLDLEAALTGHTRVRVRLGQPVLSITRVPGEERLIAVATGAESIAMVDVSTGSVTRWLAGPRSQPLGLWAARKEIARGAVAALSLDAHLTVHEVDDHDGRLELPPTVGNLYSPTISASGRWLAAESSDRVVNFYDLLQGRRVSAPVGGLEPVQEPSVDRGDRWGAVGALIVDLESGVPVGKLPLADEDGGSRKAAAAAWLEDRTLIVASFTGTRSRADEVRVAGVAYGDLEGWLEAGDPIPRAAWSELELGGAAVKQLLAVPGEPKVLVLDGNGRLRCLRGAKLELLWETTVADGSIRMALSKLPPDGASASVSPNAIDAEIYVASVDGMVRVVHLATGELLPDRAWKAAQGITRKAALNSITAGPEEGMVTTCTVDGRVQVWNAADGRRLGTLSSGMSYLRHVASVPDAPWVVAAGGFGRLLLLGQGDPPISEAMRKAWSGDDFTLEARLRDPEVWAAAAQASGGASGAASDTKRASATATALMRALERTYRYRRSDWLDAQRARLRELSD